MSATAAQPAADFTKTWRYKVGLFMIIVGNGGIVVALFLPIFGASAGLVGTLIVVGEVISLGSIVFLGKEGFKAIKSKIFAFIKSGYAGPVSRTRHYVGITLLCFNFFTTLTLAIYAWNAFDRTTPNDPIPVIWGLDFAQQGSMYFWLFLIGELSFLVAIYVLGADWWGRFRDIFVWKEPEAES